MVDCLKLSMDTELLAEVKSDMVQLSPIQTGAVTTYHAMAARINRRSQEAEDNLHRFIEEFNIRKFDNKNVNLAKLLLTAVARALGNKRLKSNSPCKVLEGMAQCSTEPFQLMVASILSLHSMASFRATLPRSTLAILLVVSMSSNRLD